MADNQYQLEGNAPQLFERDTAQPLGKPLAEQVFNHVELQASDRVLDAACGTGIVTRVAAERFEHVGKFVGLDRNTGMLDVARELSPTNVLRIENTSPFAFTLMGTRLSTGALGTFEGPVVEPATIPLLGTGLIGLILLRRRLPHRSTERDIRAERGISVDKTISPAHEA